MADLGWCGHISGATHSKRWNRPSPKEISSKASSFNPQNKTLHMSLHSRFLLFWTSYCYLPYNPFFFFFFFKRPFCSSSGVSQVSLSTVQWVATVQSESCPPPSQVAQWSVSAAFLTRGTAREAAIQRVHSLSTEPALRQILVRGVCSPSALFAL